MSGDTFGIGALTPVATGPVATVYAGRTTDTGEAVAVKLFAEKFDRATTARLDRERQALDALRAVRSILPVDGVVAHADGRSGVRMELCRGSLAASLAAGPLPAPADVLRLGAAVATALTAAHSAGVVHGAITPSNILFRASGEITVADFGLTLRERFPRDPTHALDFTAPETLRDDVRTPASDLYGLGAVLHLALTGHSPFPRRTAEAPSDRILRVLREEVQPLGTVPPPLSDLVLSLLSKDPATRPTANATLNTLAGFLAHSPTPPPHSAPPPPPTQAATALPTEVEDDAPTFNDFPSHTPPGRTLIHTTSASNEKPRRSRPTAAIAAGVALLALAAAGVLAATLLQSEEDNPAAAPPPATQQPPPRQTTSTPPSVMVRLAPPTDQGTHAELTWQADGEYDYAVVVAGEGIDTMVLMANRQQTMRVPIDEGRKYCFQIRATDGRTIHTTDPQPLRGAHCKV